MTWGAKGLRPLRAALVLGVAAVLAYVRCTAPRIANLIGTNQTAGEGE
ncbi:hypothetical protein ACH4NF_34630 [Streptomyces sp. NPDC017248]